MAFGRSPKAVGEINDPHWDDEAPALWRASRRAGLTALTVFVVMVAVAGIAVRSRMVFGTLRFWDYPDRINFCGRRYYPAGSVRGSHQALSAAVDDRTEWRIVGRTFALRTIAGPIRHPDTGSQVCAMTLYVPIGGGYRAYSLSGSP